MKAEFCWLIEYEIPPLRAIYMIELPEVSPCTESEVVKIVQERFPHWKVRKAVRKPVI